MRFKKLAFCFALPLTPIACGSSSNNSDLVKSVEQAKKDLSLQGKIFRGDCSLRLLDAVATGLATAGHAAIKSSREQYQFAVANITRSTLLYTTSDCSGDEALNFKEEGSFSIDDQQKTSDGAHNIDLHYKKVTVKSATEDGSKIAKEVTLCGTQDWSAGTSREVNAKSTDINCYRRSVPVDEKDVYKRDGSTLYLGKRGLLDPPSVRPTMIDTTTKYVAD